MSKADKPAIHLYFDQSSDGPYSLNDKQIAFDKHMEREGYRAFFRDQSSRQGGGPEAFFYRWALVEDCELGELARALETASCGDDALLQTDEGPYLLSPSDRGPQIGIRTEDKAHFDLTAAPPLRETPLEQTVGGAGLLLIRTNFPEDGQARYLVGRTPFPHHAYMDVPRELEGLTPSDRLRDLPANFEVPPDVATVIGEDILALTRTETLTSPQP